MPNEDSAQITELWLRLPSSNLLEGFGMDWQTAKQT